ncbi:MAG: AsmA family protein, partial [Halofilum sp. (in: g-proteobacteria)]|nr:AsmA family protein [Halofilum sp. (in: g-proteobacteria)]
GVLRSDTLDLRAPLLRVGGAGTLDLGRREVDYVARILVTGTLEGQGGAEFERLRGLEIPLRIRGPLTAPELELALESALEARAKAQREQLRREVQAAEERARRELEQAAEQEQRELRRRQEEAERKVRDRLEDKLKGLFD